MDKKKPNAADLVPEARSAQAGTRRTKAEDPRIRFGRHLAVCRKAKGWSQERLSLESGIARSYLGGVERGQRNIALLNICRLADTLGIPAAKLMAFD